MRSIRRSLLGYFLVLLAVALGLIAAFVDRYAVGAVKAREESETRRIEAALGTLEKDHRDKLDDELTAEARIVAREALSSRLFSPLILGGRNGPGAAVRPVEEDVIEHHRRVAALLVGAGGVGRGWTLLATVGVGDWSGALPARPGTGPRPGMFGDGWPIRPGTLWVHSEVPRVVRRVEAGLRLSFREDEPAHKTDFQVQFVAADRAGRNRYVASAASPGVGAVLPPIPEPADNTSKSETEHDDLPVGDRTYRRVVYRVTAQDRDRGGQLVVSHPVLPTAKDGPAGPRLPLRLTEYSARVAVQCVVPHALLAERMARDRAEAEAELGRVRAETRDELVQLRTKLGIIAAGSFLALVVGGWFIVARGLAPVRTLSDAVSRVSEKDFALPVVAADLSVELAPIHARITQTLDQLRGAFAREKEAVADISHELRTPIASLLATIDVSLRKPRTPEQYRTTLEDCRGIARQLGQLVERIMTLASLDAGTTRGAVTRVDAADLAGGCAVVIRPLAEAHGLAFTLSAVGPAELDTDADRLREVLMNLLHNAVEYNRPNGRVELSVRPDAGRVVFEVRDTGIGMTDEVRAKIFERFFRADASRTATGVHAGLGLAIVKEYVDRLGGTIEVESTPGEGSLFRVSFAAAAGQPESPLTPPGAAKSELRPRSRPTPAAS